MSKVFLSHASANDAVVALLRQALAELGEVVWIDSRELLGGDPLWSAIQTVIDEADAYAVLVSPASLQSKWVGKELTHALAIQKERGRDELPVIPLSLDDTQLGVLEAIFDEEPIYIPISSAPGGVDAAVRAILVALGRRLPTDSPSQSQSRPQPAAPPLEELVLALSDLRFIEQDGKRRPSARARLLYQPADTLRREVESLASWRLIAPLGPIEADDLRWYLEDYAVWPGRPFADRAQRIESDLATWGQALHRAALPAEHTTNVLQAWAGIAPRSERRFSVYLDPDTEAGMPEEAKAEAREAEAREAAVALLALPWELLHDGSGFLFQGARATRVRRRLPNKGVFDVPVLAPPIRILLVTARPEDEACGYIDHRISAQALVGAVEALGGLVELTQLRPPTLSALGEALQRALDTGTPYQVVHFDGHGIYDRQVGLGGLCFEDPRDQDLPRNRRHLTIHTDRLGPLLRQHRIPLVFLKACQSAQAEEANESVASELLKAGVASVVAMSHSVLDATAERFVGAFYLALATGRRVGEAMLAGQRALAEDSFRARIFGAGELHLQDWFVPVLFQEQADPQLFTAIPAPTTREDNVKRLQTRLGALRLDDPADPAYPLAPRPPVAFTGRSRELPALERLLLPPTDTRPIGPGRWALIRGQGGEGKTALACELGRWLVRSGQGQRAAFASVEIQTTASVVLDVLGRQLVGADYSVARYSDPDQAFQPVERTLAEQTTLLIIDNMESVLLPPYLAVQTPDALAEEAARELEAILGLARRLFACPGTLLVFTSRETLPGTFAAEANRIELQRLARKDAVQLIERSLELGSPTSSQPGTTSGRLSASSRLEVGGPRLSPGDARREEIEALVEAVHGHACTLALLGPALRAEGIVRVRESLTELMAAMERDFPGSREQSVYAGVALSLRRLSPENQERVRVLGVFHGAVDLDVLQVMMDWELSDCEALAAELVAVGLATPDPYNHLTLSPALCPYLHGRLGTDELESLTERWDRAMGGYVEFLVQQQRQKTEVAATLTLLGLANLMALLDRRAAADDAEASIALATDLSRLLEFLDRSRLLARVGQVRNAAAQTLEQAEATGGGWSHARSEAQRTRIEQQLASGQLRDALTGAQAHLERARAAGTSAYLDADYDLAGAHFLLARVLQTMGSAELVLKLLDEAGRGFEAIGEQRGDQSAKRMAAACLVERGDCLQALGRLDEAASTYKKAIALAEAQRAERDVAVGKAQLGTIRLLQRRYEDALAAHTDAREQFARLGEEGTVATTWHQIGRVQEEIGQVDAAEDAYRQALAI